MHKFFVTFFLWLLLIFLSFSGIWTGIWILNTYVLHFFKTNFRRTVLRTILEYQNKNTYDICISFFMIQFLFQFVEGVVFRYILPLFITFNFYNFYTKFYQNFKSLKSWDGYKFKFNYYIGTIYLKSFSLILLIELFEYIFLWNNTIFIIFALMVNW